MGDLKNYPEKVAVLFSMKKHIAIQYLLKVERYEPDDHIADQQLRAIARWIRSYDFEPTHGSDWPEENEIPQDPGEDLASDVCDEKLMAAGGGWGDPSPKLRAVWPSPVAPGDQVKLRIEGEGLLRAASVYLLDEESGEATDPVAVTHLKNCSFRNRYVQATITVPANTTGQSKFYAVFVSTSYWWEIGGTNLEVTSA